MTDLKQPRTAAPVTTAATRPLASDAVRGTPERGTPERDTPERGTRDSDRFLVRDGTLRHVVSPITGRTITVNPELERFVLLPGWHPEALAAAAADYEVLNRDQRRDGLSSRVIFGRRLGADVFGANNREELGDAVATLIGKLRWHCWTASSVIKVSEPVCGDLAYAEARKRRMPISRIGIVLTLLWKHGLLLAPARECGYARHFIQKVLPDITERSFGPLAALVKAVEDEPTDGTAADTARSTAGGTASSMRGRRSHILARLLMATSGIREVGEIDISVLLALGPVFTGVDADGRTMPLFKGFRPGKLLDALEREFRRAYKDRPDVLALVPKTKHLRTVLPGRGTRQDLGRGDPEYRWVARLYPERASWATAAARYIAGVENRMDLSAEVRNVDVWLHELLRQPAVPATPAGLCARTVDGAALLQRALLNRKATPARLAVLVRTCVRFFDSVLAHDARRPDGLPDPHYHNPAEQVRPPRRGARKAQTDRPVIEPWLVREIKAVLATDAWAREQADDYFLHVDPVSGRTERVWSPVRLELMRLRFLLPLRTTQVQLLDSGEGDTLRWQATADDPLAGAWVPNTGPWAPASGAERALGLLRPIYDATLARRLTGLYISTNKTSDRAEDFTDLGYEVPYEYDDVIALVLRLRAWQERYNPSVGPRKRTELAIFRRQKKASKDVEAVLPGLHYLFRDAAVAGRAHEPVTTSRILHYWLKLLDEVERRVNARVAAGDPLARPVELILKRKRGNPKVARYDLHSLRVSGLTELAVNGCPLPALMMLAGHATWVMTLYYVKPSPSDIHRDLAAARARAEAASASAAAASWEDMAATGALDALRSLRVANDPALTASAEAGSGSLTMDYGECSNGGTLCHCGGDVLQINHRDGHRYGPVLGGKTNCTSCRFFVTGPYFLGGLVARLNALSHDVNESGARLRAAEKTRRTLVTELSQLAPAAARARLSRADAAVEEAEAAAVLAAKRWMSTFRLLERSKAALAQTMAEEHAADGATSDPPASAPNEQPHARPNARRLPVVLAGTMDDLRTSLTRASEYDLWTRICEDAELYPSVDPASAALHRAVRLDRVLAEAGEGAVFATLTADERVAVGNLYARWLRTRLGEADHEAVIAGARTLRDFGLAQESRTLLAAHRVVVAPADALPGRAAPRALPAGAPAAAV